MTLGERMLILRRQRRLSQAALAKAAALHQNTIARLEQNDLHDLGGKSLVKLARALGCSADVLLGMRELDAEPEPVTAGRRSVAARTPQHEPSRASSAREDRDVSGPQPPHERL